MNLKRILCYILIIFVALSAFVILRAFLRITEKAVEHPLLNMKYIPSNDQNSFINTRLNRFNTPNNENNKNNILQNIVENFKSSSGAINKNSKNSKTSKNSKNKKKFKFIDKQMEGFVKDFKNLKKMTKKLGKEQFIGYNQVDYE